MDTKRNRSEAAATSSARTSRQATAGSKLDLVKYSFNLDDVRSIKITRISYAASGYAATGVVVGPPPPRPFKIELTVEQPMP